MPDRFPSFLCVGGAKCGTTSLYEYLRDHPQVFLPDQKELHYFSHLDLMANMNGPGTRWALESVITSEDDYLSRFASARSDQILGDISPSYLNSPRAAEAIAAKVPDARIIILLRNPVDRMFSQYMHLRRAAREDLDFEDALLAEPERVRGGWNDMFYYTRSPRAADGVRRYLELFGNDRVKIILGEDLRRDLAGEVRGILQFIGADPDVELDLTGEFNKSGEPKSKLVGRMLDASPLAAVAKRLLPRRLGAVLKQKIQAANTGKRIELPAGQRARYAELFADDVRELEALIGRETGWLPGASG